MSAVIRQSGIVMLPFAHQC